MILWAQRVDHELKNFNASDNIDENIVKINSIFQKAKNDCTKTFAPRNKRMLPVDIRRNICLRKHLLNNRKKAKTDISRRVLTKLYNRVNRQIQQQIREFDEKQLEGVCEKICDSNSTRTMWRNFNRHKNSSKQIEEPEAPLTLPDGTLSCNDKEKCDEFARYLHSVH